MKGSGAILFLCVVASCDNHSDYFETIDRHPVMELLGPTVEHGSYLRDSLKLNHVMEVNFKMVASSPVTISYTKNDNYSLLLDKQTIQVRGLKVSENLILISVEDIYRKQYEDTIRISIFDNLPPVAIMDYDITQFDSSYTLTLNGSLSFDKDERFGGSISSYEFVVNGQHYASSSSKLMYSVNKGQTYTIHFRVQDNDLVWSNDVVTYIQI